MAAGTLREQTYTLDDDGEDQDGDALDQWQQSASLDNRVALQASIAWSGLQDGGIDAGAGDSANPYSQVWWVLEPVKTMHCGDCIDLAVKSPYDPPWAGAGSNQLNQTPGDGQTECGAGCKCELDYKANWSEVDALAAAAAWQVWLGQAGADLGAMGQIGTAAGYAPGDYSGYIRQDAFASGDTSASDGAASTSDLDARANAYAAGQIGTAAGYRPGFALRGLPRRIPVLTGESAETTSAARDEMTAGQQRALDAFREAVGRWNAVRGDLPESLRLFASEADAYALVAGSGVVPPYDQLTPAQQEALGELVAALWDWADATDSADAAAQDDSELSEGALDGGVMRLGGHAPGYDQNRDAHGRWAPGDGSSASADSSEHEHEHANGGEHSRATTPASAAAASGGAHPQIGHLGEGASVDWGDAQTEAMARVQLRKLFGGRSLSDQEFAALAGARPGDTVRVGHVYDGLVSINLEGKGNAYSNDYALAPHYDARGRWDGVELGLTEIHVNARGQGQGTGTDVFARQVAAASALGVRQIAARCEKDGSWYPDRGFVGHYNGFYTWARLGFNGTLKDIGEYYGFGHLVRSTPELRGAKTIRDILRVPRVTDVEHGGEHVTGAQWWLRNGVGFRGTFDLRANSPSMQVLHEYLHEKGKPWPAQLGEGVGVRLPIVPGPIEWTADDEAAADRAWATLNALWGRRQLAAVESAIRLGGHPPGYDSQPHMEHGWWGPGQGRQNEHEAAGGRAGGIRGPAGEVHEHGGGPSAHASGAASSGDPTKGENSDPKPFTHEEFLAATLEPFKGHGGHQPVFSTVMGGREYIVKSYKYADGEHERLDHEIAARAIAKEVGLEHETIPVWREVGADGVEYGVFPRMAGKSVVEYKREDGVKEAETFRYLPESVRQRIGVWSYVLVEPDRISANFLVNPASHQVYSIDHTRAFGRQTSGEFSAAFFRHGIGNGKLNSWRDVAIPREEIRGILAHSERIVAIAEAFHVNGGGEPVRDRLTILRNALDHYDRPTYADLIEEAKRFGPRPYQKAWEVPEVKLP